MLLFRSSRYCFSADRIVVSLLVVSPDFAAGKLISDYGFVTDPFGESGTMYNKK